MSKVVRLKVPPFEATPPKSLAALRRPLVQPEETHCDAQCKPCPSCVAAQEKAIAAAKKTASDLGLKLSQLVEDALSQQLARIEAEQIALITSALEAILPDLADITLRRALLDELIKAADPLKTVTLTVRKNPELNLGTLPPNSRLIFVDDPSLPKTRLDLIDGESRTALDAQTLINACLVRLGKSTPEASAEETVT